jgi:hypothetical protein
MPIISLRVGAEMVKTNIPKEYMELVSIIKGFNKLQLIQESCQSQQDIFYLHLDGWGDSLIWVIVKAMGYRPEEFNLNTEQLEAAKPFGSFLYAMFRLAEKVINVLDEIAKVTKIKERFSDYKNAHDWFWNLCLEQELGEIFTFLFPNETNIKFGFENSNRAYIYKQEEKVLMAYLDTCTNREDKKNRMRQEIERLKNKQNPYTANGLNGHLFKLIEISTQILKINLKTAKKKEYQAFKAAFREFKQDWANYIYQYQMLLKHLHQSTTKCKMMHYKNEKLYARISGKQFEAIPLESSTTSLKITRQSRVPAQNLPPKMLTSLEP